MSSPSIPLRSMVENPPDGGHSTGPAKKADATGSALRYVPATPRPPDTEVDKLPGQVDGVDPRRFDRDHDTALTGLVHVAQIDVAVLRTELVGERVVIVRRDRCVTAQLEVPGRVGDVED